MTMEPIAAAPATGAGLDLTGLTVRYPGVRAPALAGINLAVRPGERIGVTGRTRAGKSTLALVAAGLIPRVVRATVEGQVRIDGRDGGAAGSVGIIFATPTNQLSAAKLTVREELAFGLENLAVPRAEMDPRIDAVMDRLGIAHLADREPFALSGGEQQRVAIASVVVMGPAVLVLDEPTSQLDPAGTTQMADMLDALARDGTAILCVEHDWPMLARMDRVLVLDEGRIVGLDRPAVALGRSVAGTVGLPAPALVALAEVAGIDDARAFDPTALATALAAAPAPTLVARPPNPATPDAEPAGDAPSPTDDTPWTPPRDRPVADIAIEDLRHRYPIGIEAVRGVTLAVAAGEAVAIVGQNGSGKSTLIRHLVGLLRPSGGRVRLAGLDTADTSISTLAATVGLAFQDPGTQLFERSVEREVAFGPRNLGFDDDLARAAVDGAIAAAGLDDARSTNPYDLDLPRRKLVALASVLAMDPAILVLDEPTAGQDPDGIERVGAIVRAWAAAGRTAIAVSHDLEFVARWFGRVVVLREGSVVDDGPPSRVLSAANAALLATTGLVPPPVALVAGALGLAEAPPDVPTLLAAVRAGAGRVSR